MKNITLTLSLLVLAAGYAAARGHGSSGSSFSGKGHFSRPLTRPTFGRSSRAGVASHSGFTGASSSRVGSSFAGRVVKAPGGGTTGGGGTSGGGTSAGGTTGGVTTGGPGATGSTTSPSSAAPAWATPGAKILSAGQQPVYSTPSGGGTASVNGGGFIAINQAQAGDVGRSPGVTWAQPDRTQSSGSGGISGSGATTNGPAFNPAF
jgi:hypothetical protein